MNDASIDQPHAADQVKTRTSEEPQIEISVGKDKVMVTQATVPTGIFPLPARVLRWAGLK